MLKKLFIAIAVSAGLVVAPGAPGLTFAPEAQAFSLKDTAKKAGRAVKKGAKKTGRAVKKGARKTERGARAAFCPKFDTRGPESTEPHVNNGGFCAVGRGIKKGTKKAGKAVVKAAKCFAKGGCGEIGPPPGGARIVDHR